MKTNLLIFFTLINFSYLAAPDAWADDTDFEIDIFKGADPLETLNLRKTRFELQVDEKICEKRRRKKLYAEVMPNFGLLPDEVSSLISIQIRYNSFEEIIFEVKRYLSWLDQDKLNLALHFSFSCKNRANKSFLQSSSDKEIFIFDDVKKPNFLAENKFRDIICCDKCINREQFFRFKIVLYDQGIFADSPLSLKIKALQSVLKLIELNLEFFEKK